MNKFYRCGYCGQPTDEEGKPLILDQINALSGADWDNADQTHGWCCAQQEEHEREQVTREMAMDAQDMRLEGHWI